MNEASSDVIKSCNNCQTPLPQHYNGELCPYCKENELFSRVKEYIRTHDVTEYMVADKFGISRRKVKKWITEGRIEYKELVHNKKLDSLKCEICGEPINFGVYCKKCYKKQNAPTYSAGLEKGQDSRMRFLEEKGNKR
jgi:RNA polymerase subunit RPABC4/transcription elongation factor Spt4